MLFITRQAQLAPFYPSKNHSLTQSFSHTVFPPNRAYKSTFTHCYSLQFTNKKRQHISYFTLKVVYLAIILAIMNQYSIDKNPTDIRKELAQRTRTLRKEIKMSQSELAQRANVSLGSYKRFEASGQISLDSLLKIAFILGKMSDFELIFQPNKNKDIEKLFK
jgi:DNA-binding XRE family transcriptional regulator